MYIYIYKIEVFLNSKWVKVDVHLQLFIYHKRLNFCHLIFCSECVGVLVCVCVLVYESRCDDSVPLQSEDM